jgi:hypothetical protein
MAAGGEDKKFAEREATHEVRQGSREAKKGEGASDTYLMNVTI